MSTTPDFTEIMQGILTKKKLFRVISPDTNTVRFTQMFLIFIQLDVLIGGGTLSVLSDFHCKNTTGARDTQRIRWGKEVLEEFKGIAHVPSRRFFSTDSARLCKNYFPLGSFKPLKTTGNKEPERWILRSKIPESIRCH